MNILFPSLSFFYNENKIYYFTKAFTCISGYLNFQLSLQNKSRKNDGFMLIPKRSPSSKVSFGLLRELGLFSSSQTKKMAVFFSVLSSFKCIIFLFQFHKYPSTKGRERFSSNHRCVSHFFVTCAKAALVPETRFATEYVSRCLMIMLLCVMNG